jgi:hypothetical protein
MSNGFPYLFVTNLSGSERQIIFRLQPSSYPKCQQSIGTIRFQPDHDDCHQILDTPVFVNVIEGINLDAIILLERKIGLYNN